MLINDFCVCDAGAQTQRLCRCSSEAPHLSHTDTLFLLKKTFRARFSLSCSYQSCTFDGPISASQAPCLADTRELLCKNVDKKFLNMCYCALLTSPITGQDILKILFLKWTRSFYWEARGMALVKHTYPSSVGLRFSCQHHPSSRWSDTLFWLTSLDSYMHVVHWQSPRHTYT